MNCNDSYERALKKIEEAKKNRPQCCSCMIIGPTGPTDTYKSVSEYF